MHICAGDIIRERTGRPLTLFQRMVVPVLARLIHEDEINAILKDYGHLPPYEFLRVVIHHVFGCSYTIYTACPLSALSRPPVFVSNHPLGGLDGIILLLALHDMGYNTRVIVNDLLMYVEPLRGLFVPVNKMGAQRRDYVRAMNELWRSDCPILTFPAGACSRLIDGRVQDLPWHESYLRLAERYNRPIVPIHFDGRNSMLFYRVAQLRRWLHIRFNIEMLLLPREMFRARGHHYHIQLSSPLNSKLMQAIIAPVATRVLVRELSRLSSLCRTRCAGNLVYDFMAHEAPEVMREVARLRELTYREAGGASGQSLDMDDFDTRGCYRQLIVWDPDHEQIVGGYRYCCCQHAEQMADGQPLLTSSHLFHYSDMFIADYLPYTMELGRAFVQPMYQHGAMGVKSLYALDNLWEGIGAVLYAHPQLRYLIGKVTVFPPYDALSRDLLYAYLSRYYADRQGLVVPKHPIGIDTAHQAMADELFADADAATALHCLQHTVRAHGCTLPPLFTAYLHLTNSMLYFGTARNDELSLSYETGLLIAVADIHPDKQKRYIHAN